MTESRPGEHIPALDAVRGMAISLVLLFHFSSYGHGLPFTDVLADRVFHTVSRAGWIGVDLFFVLSGFLITGLLYDSKTGPHYFRNFYARRALRIFPLYYGSLVIFLVALPRLFPDSESLRALQSDGVWYWAYVANVKFALDGWPSFGALGHFWSLAVEEQFYLVWPVFVLFLGRAQLVTLCVLCIAGSFAARVALTVADYPTAAFVLTPARLDALAVGAILALTVRHQKGGSLIARWAEPAAAGLGALLLGVFVWREGLTSYDPVISTVGHTLLACWFGAVLGMALTKPHDTVLGRVFSSTALRFMGRYSYGLYVFHHPILFFQPGLLPLGWVPTIFGSMLLKKLVFIMAATSVSIVVAVISWHAYEKQFLKLKSRFSYERRRARDADTPAEVRTPCPQTAERFPALEERLIPSPRAATRAGWAKRGVSPTSPTMGRD